MKNDTDGRDRPALETEVEITPAMMEAAMRELARYRYADGNEDEVIRRLYRAMNTAKPS